MIHGLHAAALVHLLQLARLPGFLRLRGLHLFLNSYWQLRVLRHQMGWRHEGGIWEQSTQLRRAVGSTDWATRKACDLAGPVMILVWDVLNWTREGDFLFALLRRLPQSCPGPSALRGERACPERVLAGPGPLRPVPPHPS